jgi:hypothetical protein
MRAGQITAKLRDAVPVRFMENGEEMKRYKNIDIPDSLKELEIQDFQFDVTMDGKITFQLFFEEGILPDIFPENRVKMTRAEKAAAKAATTQQESKTEPDAQKVIVNISEPTPAIENIEVKYNLTGERRKELVTAAGKILNTTPAYQAAPTFAYTIGKYTIDKNGTLTGQKNEMLVNTLAEQGFIAE